MKRIVLLISMIILLTSCGTSDKEETATGETQEEMASEEIVMDEETKQLIENFKMTAGAEQIEEGIIFTMELQNKNEEDLSLTFSSGQQFEILLTKDGENIYRYSEEKMFTQALIDKEIRSGEKLFWKEIWQPKRELEPGKYQVEIMLLPQEINRQKINQSAFTKKLTLELSDIQEELEEVQEPFRNIEVSGKHGNYQLKGEVHGSIGEAYYEVEDGHQYLVEQTPIEVEGETWQEFQLDIIISEDLIPQNGTLMLLLFNKDRSIQLPVVLEQQ
ncbi:BsuPI-related putative proteinase inhibitor [Gracilibacillus dipsosauri]|nr:BsuPI-related putative proteinase inhibitor [Gracilibacillus dipsosauri]